MNDIRIMHGAEDLTGRTFGKIRVIGMASRRPLKWECRCLTCNTGYTLTSETARRGECLDSLCGRTFDRASPSLAHTATTAHAVRSRDSASAAAFAREQTQVHQRESQEWMRKAAFENPEGFAKWIDSERKKT